MGRNDSQGFLTRDQSFKVNPGAMETQQKVQIGQNNLELSKNKRDEFKKAVYLLSTGQLKNRQNTKAELGADEQGSFNGDKKAQWGVSISDHNFFHNPATPKPEPVDNSQLSTWSEPDKIEPTTIPEPVKEKPPFIDNLKPEKSGLIRNQENYDLSINGFNNFNLGSGSLDQFRNESGIDFQKYLGSLPPEQQKELEQTYTRMKDPNYRQALGTLNFNTGTDATRMSAGSRQRLTEAYNNPDNAAGKFARENGLKLDEDGMQRMLGYERYNETNSLFEAGAKHYGVDSKGLVNPYKKENHTKGKKVDNKEERYGKFQSVNGNTVTVDRGQTKINAQVQNTKMPWQR